MFDIVLDRFHHNDRVVHDDSDREDQTEQRQGIQTESKRQHRRKCSDNRHGNGHEGNNGRSPALQEDQHNDGHQNHGVSQGDKDFPDGLANEWRRVIHDGIVHSLRKSRFQIVHFCADISRCFQGIGTRQLVNRQCNRWLGVQCANLIVGHCSQFHARDIPESNHAALSIGSQHNLTELLFTCQSSQRRHRVLKRLPLRRRLLTNLSGGDLSILLLNRPQHVLSADIPSRHLLRIKPDSHAVVALAKERNVSHPRHARQLIPHLNGGIVAEVQIVPRFIRREQIDDHQHAGCFLLHRDAAALHQVRQRRLGQCDAILHQDLRKVEISAGGKRDR